MGIFSRFCFFATEGSAHITVKAHEETSASGSLGTGAAAWKALADRFDGNTKKARRACRAQLFSAVMESGEDPADFLSKMDDLRLRLRDMGEEITDESYEVVILQALPKEYDFVRQTSHRDRSFGLPGIRSTVINMYIDELSRKSSSPSFGTRRCNGSGNRQCPISPLQRSRLLSTRLPEERQAKTPEEKWRRRQVVFVSPIENPFR